MIHTQNGYIVTLTPVRWGDRLVDYTDRYAYGDGLSDTPQKVKKQQRWTDRQTDIFHSLLPQRSLKIIHGQGKRQRDID